MKKTTCKELSNFYLLSHFDVVIESKVAELDQVKHTRFVQEVKIHHV